MSSPGCAEAADMVALLREERTNAPAVRHGEPQTLRWVAGHVGVHERTVGDWERGQKIPVLRNFVIWCGVFAHRISLTDGRDQRWNWGFAEFDERHWDDPARAAWFAELELLRLRHALKTAREVTGVPVQRIAKDIHAPNMWRWESGEQAPRLDNFVRWAGTLGLCPSLEHVDQLSHEAPDRDPTALRPDREHDESGALSCR